MTGNRILDAKIPGGPLADKWDKHMIDSPLVAPGGNRRKKTVIVVGTGLAGGGAAATMGELGYNVLNFCIQDNGPFPSSFSKATGTMPGY